MLLRVGGIGERGKRNRNDGYPFRSFSSFLTTEFSRKRLAEESTRSDSEIDRKWKIIGIIWGERFGLECRVPCANSSVGDDEYKKETTEWLDRLT